MAKLLLAPVDGSDQSKKSLDFAIDLALYYKADLKLVYVAQPFMVDEVFAMGAIAVPVNMDDPMLEKYGKEVLDKAATLAAHQGVTSVGQKMLIGDPARAILKYAEEIKADMIVIGSRGIGDLASFLVGSVSHKVAHDAKCSCITVK